MTGLCSTLSGKLGSKTLLALAVAAGLAGLAPTARADDDGRYGDRHGRDYRHTVEHRYERVRQDRDDDHYDHRDHRHGERRDARARVWIEPAYKTVRERVWVEPVYKTVCDRVWIEPEYKTVYDDVYVPARYELREVVHYHRGHRHVTCERVLVEPACTRRVPRNVCIREGRWDVIERRVCVSEGHWDVVERRVCVSEGRWDYRIAGALSVRF